jgi:hypothetical protein
MRLPILAGRHNRTFHWTAGPHSLVGAAQRARSAVLPLLVSRRSRLAALRALLDVMHLEAVGGPAAGLTPRSTQRGTAEQWIKEGKGVL